MKRYTVLILLLTLVMGCSTETKPAVTPSTEPHSANKILKVTPEPVKEVPSGWISFDSEQDGGYI